MVIQVERHSYGTEAKQQDANAKPTHPNKEEYRAPSTNQKEADSKAFAFQWKMLEAMKTHGISHAETYIMNQLRQNKINLKKDDQPKKESDVSSNLKEFIPKQEGAAQSGRNPKAQQTAYPANPYTAQEAVRTQDIPVTGGQGFVAKEGDGKGDNSPGHKKNQGM